MRKRFPESLVAIVSILWLVASCGGSSSIRLGGPSYVLVLEGGFAAPRALELERDGTVVARLELDGLELGLVDELSADYNYDPWQVFYTDDLPAQPPPGLEFVPAAGCEVEQSSGDRLVLGCSHGEFRSTLTVIVEDAGRFRFLWQPAEPDRVAFMRVGIRPAAGQGFYGLGGVLDSPEHTGRVRAMQMEYDSATESGTNEMHFPVPLVVGTAGFGLFMDSYLPGTFDVLSSEPQKVIVTYGTGEFSGQGLDFYLFAAAHPLDVYKHYFAVTGTPALPAPWALGPWIWRDENDDQAQVESDARIIRELDLATCALWIDRPYASGVNSFDFEPAKFPDPQRMVETLHGLGFRLALWHTPYIDSHDPDTADLYEQAKQAGYFPPLTGPILNNWSEPIDFTNPEAYEFWQQKLEYYRDLGVEGYKLDYAEDVVLGIAGARMPWLFHDGSDERTMHSLYQLGYHRAYAEMLPPDGGFLLTRAGAHRDQALTRVVWPGDLDANMARHGEAAEQHGQSFVAVGGLPASVIYGLSLSASGYPFYGSDTGGYRHSPPDRETFTRWFEQTAFSTVMQVGTSTNDVPWEFRPENGFDEEMLGWYRRYARWHLRLWPYLWTQAVAIAETGRPIARPVGLAWPELGQHPDDHYMLGPDLLVAPVMERSARTKKVVFPPGRWYDFWTGELFEGDRQVELDAPLDAIPVFQRAGTIVPLLRPTIDTLAPAEDPDVDSFHGNPGRLWLRAAPAGEGTLRVYDGSVIEMKEDGELRFDFSAGNVFTSGYVLEIYGFERPPAVAECDSRGLDKLPSGRDLESSAAGWYHDAEKGWLYVVVEAGTSQCSIRR